MKKLKADNENCIPIITSCVEWNGGSIEYLGICDGDSLNTLLWEVITKLQEIAGEDLSAFDIDSLTEICQLKAPLEVNILSILTLLKDNQVCLKDFIDELNTRLEELFKEQSVTIDLKCYANIDNLGNTLSITRAQLDQLIIDRLCEYKQRIESIEGDIILIKNDIAAIDPTATVEELSFDTCLDPGVDKPTSTNVVNLAEAHCDLEAGTGTAVDMSNAQAFFPTGSVPASLTSSGDWIGSPANQAEVSSNTYLVIGNLLDRLATIEATCCSLSCNDIDLGFTALFNEDGDGIIISFTWGAGTSIPAGFEDCGSTVLITDVDGNTVSANYEISNNSTDEVNITGLNTLSPLTVMVTAKLCTAGNTLTCQKCLTRTVTSAQCAYCTYTAGGTGSVAIIYTIPND